MVDMIAVMGLISVLAAIAIPTIQRIGDSIALGQAQRLVQSTLQQARLKAVTANRIMRVRFNCPAAGQMRMLELIGTPTAPATQDVATNRCSDTVYPYPAADYNPVTLPNHDGPLTRIGPPCPVPGPSCVTFGTTQTIEFRPSGMAWSVNTNGTSNAPLAGNGVSITVSKGGSVKAVTVNALGRVQ
jgi:type II secretory pathway pseudopilin PulG